MYKIPSQTEIDEVFCAFYELSHRYKMIYGVDYKILIKVLEFWNELGKKEMDMIESLKYEPKFPAPEFPEYDYDEQGNIFMIPKRHRNDT
jgi:hypothetical protein